MERELVLHPKRLEVGAPCTGVEPSRSSRPLDEPVGARCDLIATIGNDSGGTQLRGMLAEIDVDVGSLVITRRPTTTKTRIVARFAIASALCAALGLALFFRA